MVIGLSMMVEPKGGDRGDMIATLHYLDLLKETILVAPHVLLHGPLRGGSWKLMATHSL